MRVLVALSLCVLAPSALAQDAGALDVAGGNGARPGDEDLDCEALQTEFAALLPAPNDPQPQELALQSESAAGAAQTASTEQKGRHGGRGFFKKLGAGAGAVQALSGIGGGGGGLGQVASAAQAAAAIGEGSGGSKLSNVAAAAQAADSLGGGGGGGLGSVATVAQVADSFGPGHRATNGTSAAQKLATGTGAAQALGGLGGGGGLAQAAGDVANVAAAAQTFAALGGERHEGDAGALVLPDTTSELQVDQPSALTPEFVRGARLMELASSKNCAWPGTPDAGVPTAQ